MSDDETRVRLVHQLADMNRDSINKRLQIETIETCARLGRLADEIGYSAVGEVIWKHIKSRT